MIRALMGLCAALCLAGAALSEETLADPEAEARARALMHELACLVCEGQPISESDAAVAVRMRAEVRALVSEGQSDAEVRDYMQAQYGRAALLRPPREGINLILWVAPLLLVVIGGGLVWRLLGPQTSVAPNPEQETGDGDQQREGGVSRT